MFVLEYKTPTGPKRFEDLEKEVTDNKLKNIMSLSMDPIRYFEVENGKSLKLSRSRLQDQKIALT